ncbi:hypothetical protein ACTJIJ_03810 [Niabella sp. 22666]|uniref:hypothetical protein n=1 Tax=Niabella sp. 22666 TaxID=3453954 RepID=UPI003F877CDA
MRKYLIPAFTLLVFGAINCKKIQQGFLSETLRYTSPDLYAQRGLALVQSAKIFADGSTPPISFELLNLRDSSGKPLPEAFNTKYDVTVFKPGMSFNAETDTTVALLNAKRETVSVFPMDFNKASGQLSFNKAALNIPLGIYNFDIKATNSAGSRVYPSFGRIHVVDPTQEDMFLIEDNVNNAFDLAGTTFAKRNPILKFTRVSADGARIILKISDKNGSAFNPRKGEVIARGDRPTFLSYAKFNPVVFTDTALVCDFEVAPFPLAKYIAGGTDWGHLIYYRIPEKNIIFDGSSLGTLNANLRFAFTIKMEGTFIIEYQLPDAVRVPAP